MELKPVQRYNLPNYPDKMLVYDSPDMLKALPSRWKGKVSVGVALSTAALLMLAGCSEKVASDGSKQIKPGIAAPVFAHGEGTGAFGCVSVIAPVFLSEDEAYKIIHDTAKKEGITFIKDEKIELKDVKIPATNLYLDFSGEPKSMEVRKGTLELDGLDKENRIAFEYISLDDYKGWQKKSDFMSTVESYDFLSAANTLKEGINGKTGEKTVGIFYNPMPNPDFNNIPDNDRDRTILEKNLHKQAEEQLKEQVKDFIKWLKAEGIV